jgi:hypothetical protein
MYLFMNTNIYIRIRVFSENSATASESSDADTGNSEKSSREQ